MSELSDLTNWRLPLSSAGCFRGAPKGWKKSDFFEFGFGEWLYYIKRDRI
ncbi:MAG TPA: hypothetical protein VIL70_00600 [Chthoniobacterales bacterium]